MAFEMFWYGRKAHPAAAEMSNCCFPYKLMEHIQAQSDASAVTDRDQCEVM